jgi:hypothetical protein
LSGNSTDNPTPAFTFSASSSFAPIAPPVDGLYFQIDAWQGPWIPASSTGDGGFSGTSPALLPGTHILYAYAADGQDATSTMTIQGGGSSPLVGAISGYVFLVTQPATLQSISVTPANPSIGLGRAQRFTATGTYSDGTMQDLSSSVTWASANTPVATITAKGVATGVTPGTSLISATLGSISGSTTLTVQPNQATLLPASLNFANQKVGTSSPPQKATLTNTGLGTLTISGIVATGDFFESTNCGSRLLPGASCTINVTFTPTMEGARTGSLTATDNATPSTQTSSLAGTGLAPLVTLSPANLAFGNQKAGTKSAPQQVTLTNTGNAGLLIKSISIAGTEFTQTNNCMANLGAGQSCKINVVFAPTKKGSATANLTVQDSAASGTQKVPLTGTGT